MVTQPRKFFTTKASRYRWSEHGATLTEGACPRLLHSVIIPLATWVRLPPPPSQVTWPRVTNQKNIFRSYAKSAGS